MITNVKDTLDYGETQATILPCSKKRREKGWMKNDCSQPGRGVRARQQGYNILGRLLEDRQSEAGRLDGVQPTTSWCVMKMRRG